MAGIPEQDQQRCDDASDWSHTREFNSVSRQVAHPIPYQGSKRRLASVILEHFSSDIEVLYEPFAGSGAVTLAAASRNLAKQFVLGDSLEGLIEIWSQIIEDPHRLADDYDKIWHGQQPDPRGYYDRIRDEFNREGGAGRLLFLLARCVKNAVRFNGAGHFNQSPDKRRLGTQPKRMARSIHAAHALLQGKAEAHAVDYSALLDRATPADLVYMDPPYQGTSGGRDQRYHKQLEREAFVVQLERLRVRGVPFIISFDGRLGSKTYGAALPERLGLTRLEVHAGRSSQATLNGSSAETYESLYLSPELASDGMQLARSVFETAQATLPGI